MKKNITICMGSSCFARGNRENLAVVEEFIKTNNLVDEIKIEGSCCEENCAKGPNIIIDDKLYGNMDPLALRDLLRENFLTGRKQDERNG